MLSGEALTMLTLKGGMFSLFEPSSVKGEVIFTRFALGVVSGVRRPHSLDSLADGDDGGDGSDGACRFPNTVLRVETGMTTSPGSERMVVDVWWSRRLKGGRTAKETDC